MEFANVPSDWGIEARKPTEKEEKETDAEASADEPSTAVNRFSKRTKGILTEEQLVQRWNSAHTWFFNPPQTSYDDGEEEGDEGDEGEEEEEEEFEDAMDADDATQAAQEQDVKPEGPPPEVVMIQEAEPPLHKPVPGMPVLDLGVIQKFMATGHL